MSVNEQSKTNAIEFVFGGWYDAIVFDGRLLDPSPSQRLFNHSPDGFAWGYGGSGPAQAALAILLAAGVADEKAVRLHQDFKDEFVATLPENFCGTIDIDVLAWASGKGEA